MNSTSTSNSTKAVAFPHPHTPVTYYAAENVEFQAMLTVWYQVADMLRLQPPGTLIEYTNGTFLVMGEVAGKLVMFDSIDIGWDSTKPGISFIPPERFDGIDGEDLDTLRESLEAWLANPVFHQAYTGEFIAQVITHNTGLPSEPNWVWCGEEVTIKYPFHPVTGERLVGSLEMIPAIGYREMSQVNAVNVIQDATETTVSWDAQRAVMCRGEMYLVTESGKGCLAGEAIWSEADEQQIEVCVPGPASQFESVNSTLTQLHNISAAGKAVIAAWENGDLAGAVHALESELASAGLI